MSVPEWFIPYWKAIDDEYIRIGFTPDELLHLAMDGIPNEDEAKKILADLRRVPTGVGAETFYEREGGDYESLKEAVEEYHRTTESDG